MSNRSLKFFLIATFIVFDLFVAANIVAAHVLSDCGLPAWLRTSGCADDIKRAGFPLIFIEEGGFGYRYVFEPVNLAFDVVLALGVSVIVGVVVQRLAMQGSDG